MHVTFQATYIDVLCRKTHNQKNVVCNVWILAILQESDNLYSFLELVVENPGVR